MLNTFVIVGKVAAVPEIKRTVNGNVVANMIVEADRSFRNENGEITKDLFKIILWRGIAEECAAVCGPGSLVAVKGRLQSDVHEKDGRSWYNTEIVAEKVSYLPQNAAV